MSDGDSVDERTNDLPQPEVHPDRVLILEDEPIMRQGLEALLGARGLSARATGNPEEFLALVVSFRPGVTLHDLKLHRDDREYRGLQYIRKVKELSPNTRCIVLTQYPSTLNFTRALKAGAEGFVAKENVVPPLDEVIRLVVQGHRWYDGTLVATVVPFVDDDRLARFEARARRGDASPLTAREHEVLCLLADNLSNPQIADRLGISVETVKTHNRHINEKLQANSRTDAVEAGRSCGYL